MDSSRHVLITRDGLEHLKRQLDTARLRREEAAPQLRETLQPGDVEDNPEFEQAKDELVALDGRIKQLEAAIDDAGMIEDGHTPVIGPGSTVEVEDDHGAVVVYQLVGGLEADPANGRVSIDRPVGRALIGKTRGQRLSIETPGGAARLTIKSIR